MQGLIGFGLGIMLITECLSSFCYSPLSCEGTLSLRSLLDLFLNLENECIFFNPVYQLQFNSVGIPACCKFYFLHNLR